jgi:hypothetical protein
MWIEQRALPQGSRSSRDAEPVPEGAVVIEVDEMWHYLGAKANKLWIWMALDRAA